MPAGHPPVDRAQLEGLVRDYRAGRLGGDANRIEGPLVIPTDPPMDLDGPDAGVRGPLERRGKDALAEGSIGVLVMAGGMATRFGGSAKAVVPIVTDQPDATFLRVKLADACRRAPAVAAVVMCSFATRPDVDQHLAQLDWCGVATDRRFVLDQSAMPRLTPDGTPLPEHPDFADLDARLLYAPPGHGDLIAALQAGDVLPGLRALGVRHLLISNVDNLGATLDPLVVGAHLEGGAALSTEVVRRPPGEAGASICQLEDGRVVIVEDMRMPAGIDPTAFPHFNVNSLWLDLATLESQRKLRWFAVRKRVTLPDGTEHEVVQLEQLVGQLSELIPTKYLAVARRRFLPVKTQAALADARDEMLAYAREAGVIG